MTPSGPQPQDAQAEIAALKQQLAECQKLTALGELLGTTTHEFNNVLMTVLNYAKMGLRRDDEATRTKALTKILQAGERASKITHSVLGMARNRDGRKEPTSVGELVRQTMVLMEREMSKYQIMVDLELDENAPPAVCDGNQIQQVMLNLLINARQAIGERGEIRIRVGRDATTGMVELMVRDSGKGIPQSELPKIFEPFYSTKAGPDASGKGGTGLGLSACRDIIEAHRGRIRVESTVGRGTAFIIKLPTAAAEHAA